MDALAKSVFTGHWKSFKMFRKSGDIRYDKTVPFREMEFESTGVLTIRQRDAGGIRTLAHTDNWRIELKNKAHYIHVTPEKLVFEVITINHTLMVLADTATSDKIFFARDCFWPGMMSGEGA
ncbi:MAG: hypothetical protein JWP27_2645 [Flaviaesturariibacter sp.]|nr:hypothetical protein [Flaviaesturariibacter sp.]